jgi:monoamine oxidase
MSQPLRGRRVVIAGAGLSGLTAAYKLANAGASVHVFEASDRIGGRVWTFRETPIAPFHAELGGELIESDHKALRALCREFRLPLTRILLRGFGLVVRLDGRTRVYARQTPLWKKFSDAFEPHVQALKSANLALHSAAAASIARRSVMDVLNDAKAGASVKALAVALRNLYVAEPDGLSALVTTQEVLAGGDPTHIAMYRIVGGNDRLVSALVENSQCRIDRHHVVRMIRHQDDEVRVTVDGPGRRRASVAADAVVVAVPVPLLRELVFEPSLSDAQRLAFDSLSVGAATKALLRYSSPWWRKPGLPRAFGTNLPIGAVWDSAEEQRGAAILTLLAGANAAGELRRLLSAREPTRVTGELSWLNQGSRERPRVRAFSWDRYRWARGAYEYFSPRFDPALQPLLGRGAGRVLFAGAHTSRDFPGYMNGAVESGVRAADEVAQLLK